MKTQIHVRITRELHSRLKNQMREDERSVSWHVEKALEKHLAKTKKIEPEPIHISVGTKERPEDLPPIPGWDEE